MSITERLRRPFRRGDDGAATDVLVLPPRAGDVGEEDLVHLRRRRDALTTRVAELQWDLGGLVYEMAIRDRIRTSVIVNRAADLQAADAELREVERILLLEQTGVAGACEHCSAPHSSGAVYCWQCGQPLMARMPDDALRGS